MSTDPHSPTPAGADPDEAAGFAPPTDVHETAGDDAATPLTPAATVASPTLEPADTVVSGPDAAQAADDHATPAPDPTFATPSAFTPPGTPEADGPLAQAKAMAEGPLAQASAMSERPEVQVGLAFVGGAVLSFVLKRFGR